MKLYYKPGACSMSARIILNELDLTFDAVRVDTDAGKTQTGADYREINHKGYVPALELSNGAVLTENPAILQFLADNGSPSHRPSASDPFERARLQEWLNFTSSELHKAFGPYFRGKPLDAGEKADVNSRLVRRIETVERALADGRTCILGEMFTVADAYLFVVLNWSSFIDFDLTPWPNVAAYVARQALRPSIRLSMQQEGLLPGEAAA